jgi:hypothetical protein
VIKTWGTLPGGQQVPPTRVTRIFEKKNGQWQQAAAPRWHAYVAGRPFMLLSDGAANRILNGQNNSTGGLVFEGGIRVAIRVARRVALVPRIRMLTTEHLYYDGYLHGSKWGTQAFAGFGARVLF